MQYDKIRSLVVNFFGIFSFDSRTVNWTVQLRSHLWVLQAGVVGQNIETEPDSTRLAFWGAHPDVTGRNFSFGHKSTKCKYFLNLTSDWLTSVSQLHVNFSLNCAAFACLLQPARAFEYSIDSLYKYIVYLIGGRKYQNWYCTCVGTKSWTAPFPVRNPGCQLCSVLHCCISCATNAHPLRPQ